MYVFTQMLLIRQTRATMVMADVNAEALQLLRCVVLRIGNPIFGPMTALLLKRISFVFVLSQWVPWIVCRGCGACAVQV